MDTTRIKTLETPPEDFYGQSDSAYLKIQYIQEQDGYKFETRNEIFHNAVSYEELSEGAKALAILMRGLAEMAIQYPANVYQLGLQAANKDFIDNADIPKEQIELLRDEPKGSA